LIREILLKLYKKYDIYFNVAFKFFFALIVFTQINSSFGYAAVLKKSPVVILLSIIAVLIPQIWFVLLVGIFSIINIFFLSTEMAIITGILMLVIFLMYVRMTPSRGYLLIAIPLLFKLNFIVAVPIALALFSSPASVLVVVVGTLMYYFGLEIPNIALYKSTELSDLPNVLIDMYKYLVSNFLGNKQMILSILVFIAIAVIVYIIRSLRIDYNHYIAIAAGTITNLVFYIIGNLILKAGISVPRVLFASLIGGIIAMVIQFMRFYVDYHRTESVQFEDDDYYYYVKAVPKIKVTAPNKKVSKINTRSFRSNQQEDN
jgi:hypothetical protein